MRARDLEGLIVTALPNIAYLTGFFASAAALVVTPAEIVLIGDGRYAVSLQQRQRECAFLRTQELLPGSSYDQAVVGVLSPHRGLRFGFEAAHLTVTRHKFLTGALDAQGWTTGLVDSEGMLERQRSVKDAWEIGRLRDGAARLSSVAKCILPRVLAGRTEAEVAAELEQELRRVGFERPAFDTIVASGPNAALPHARAGVAAAGGGRPGRHGLSGECSTGTVHGRDPNDRRRAPVRPATALAGAGGGGAGGRIWRDCCRRAAGGGGCGGAREIDRPRDWRRVFSWHRPRSRDWRCTRPHA